MLVKTRGIVLQYLKYQETSIITRIYTEQLGLQSYIVNGVRSPKARQNRMARFQALTLLDMVAYYKPHRAQLNRLAEVRCAHPFVSLPFEVKKTGLALFLAEIFGKTLQEETGNVPLFDFLWNHIRLLDSLSQGYEDFHLFMLVRLSAYLGFGVEAGQDLLRELEECKPLLLPASERQIWTQAIDTWLAQAYYQSLAWPSSQRGALLDGLLDFYRLHFQNFDSLKSLNVLRALNRA
ncbi:MAG: DNA repair protein RecO [Microscillaceae bacterium]|nr:DNA repair protein RecO [Microscillaceae bacterium]